MNNTEGLKEMKVKDQPKVNAYTCGGGCPNTVVKHRDKGVTPMFIECVHCHGRAVSHMYQVPQDLEHDLVAFAPQNNKEWRMYKKEVAAYYDRHWPQYTQEDLKNAMEATRHHVKKGGVIMVPKDKISL